MKEAHQHGASLYMVRCTRCNNLFLTSKVMSWQTLTVGLLKVYGRGSPLNLNSLWEAYFLPSLVHVAYQDLQHTSHIFLTWPNQQKVTNVMDQVMSCMMSR